MRPVTQTLPRFAPMHAWANRILRVDLSDVRIWAQETAPYVPDYLGARGIAARICWDEYPEPVGEFDPANPLMVFPGALAGSRAPYSGRTNVCGFSPQASPHRWFTRSSIGGHVGGELKRAGFDGIVVTGAAEEPVRIRIRDDDVSVLPADDLWGLDALDALEALERADGRGTRSLTIGPAGERRSRIAAILTASSSAAGQGGFGGVMGAKSLKAISVQGTGRISLARPEVMSSMKRVLASSLVKAGRKGPMMFGRDLAGLNRQLADAGGGSAQCRACTEGCLTPCQAYLQDVPGVVHDRNWSGAWFCVSALVQPGQSRPGPGAAEDIFDWELGQAAAFEMNVLSNRYGLNQFDLLMGMAPWLIACQKAGLISELNGMAMDWRSPEFWATLFHAIAYREGMGDALAEGGWGASQALGLGVDLARARYPGWGQPSHWDGRDGGQLVYPVWVSSALQWMSDTRDPFSTGHGSLWPNGATTMAARLEGVEREAALKRIRDVGARVYGTPDAGDPFSGYLGKAAVGYYHAIRPIVKDTVPVDDLSFPLIFDGRSPDGLWRLEGIEGLGDIPGTSVEAHLFAAGTGLDWSEEELNRAAERVCTLERAVQVRHWGRDRATDEMVLPYFERKELYQNPLLERKHALDREQFAPVADEFYRRHGWDPATGRPTQETLDGLGLGDVYAPMMAGAKRVVEESAVG